MPTLLTSQSGDDPKNQTNNNRHRRLVTIDSLRFDRFHQEMIAKAHATANEHSQKQLEFYVHNFVFRDLAHARGEICVRLHHAAIGSHQARTVFYVRKA